MGRLSVIDYGTFKETCLVNWGLGENRTLLVAANPGHFAGGDAPEITAFESPGKPALGIHRFFVGSVLNDNPLGTNNSLITEARMVSDPSLLASNRAPFAMQYAARFTVATASVIIS